MSLAHAAKFLLTKAFRIIKCLQSWKSIEVLQPSGGRCALSGSRMAACIKRPDRMARRRGSRSFSQLFKGTCTASKEPLNGQHYQ